MDAPLLGAGWRLATWIPALAIVAWAVWTAPWRSWLGDPERQHVWLGSVVVALALWAMQAGLTPGLAFHFLLATALTLMHGWQLAIVGLAIVLTVLCVMEPSNWQAWGMYLLAEGAVPVFFVSWLHGAVQRRLPHNYFVYFFVTVFFGSMLAFNLAGAARLLVLAGAGALPSAQLADEWLVFLPLMSFGEPFLNGIVLAMAVVYRPQWVASFDDRLYLAPRKPGPP
jgi:uncharacterized membrane protein